MLPFTQPKQVNPELALHNKSLNISERQGLMDAAMYDDPAYVADTERREDLLRWQQDLDKDLEALKHDLRNETKNKKNDWVPIMEKVWNDKKEDYDTKPMPPRVNENGISFIISNIKQHVNRNTMRCSLNEVTIMKKMKIFGNDLCIALAVNFDRFGINMTEYPLLNTTIRNMVHFTLLRALNDGERKSEREIRKFIEASIDRPQQASDKKLMSLFGGGS